MEQARKTVAEVKEQRRLQRSALFAAHKALIATKDAFERIAAASSHEIDRERWRERQTRVEAELKRITKGMRP
jgi:hypothetical protein